MTSLSLRPLGLGELLDVSFSLYRQLFGTLIVVALATNGLPQVINVYIEASGGIALNPLLWLGNAVFSMVLGAIGVGASTHIISENYLGERINAGAAFGRVVPQLGAIIVLSIVTTIAIGFGMLLFLVPGVIIACGLAVSTTALVLEKTPGPVAAMSRSWDLTRGHRGRIFGVLVTAFLLLVIPSMAIGVVAAIIGSELLLTVVAVGITLAISPFFYVALTVLYYDLRVRKEGFDLEMLTQQVRG